MNPKAIVFDVQKYCIHDGPGVRTNIFLKGCSLRCKWCANPESQNGIPELFINKIKCIGCGNCIESCHSGAVFKQGDSFVFDRSKCRNCGGCTVTCYSKARKMFGKEYTVAQLIREAERDMEFYRQSGGGITFSGGEPGLWPDIVKPIAKYFKEKGVSTAIETCGFVPWENFEKILPYLDIVMYDVKIWDPEKHEYYCGGSNTLIFDNLKKICKRADTVVRIPIIPGINDSEEELRHIADFLQSLDRIRKIHILAYHHMALGKYDGMGRNYPLPEIKPPSGEHMEEIKRLFEEYGFVVKIGG